MPYSAVVLDDKSQQVLKDFALDPATNVKVNSIRLPIHVRDNGWKVYCHHMTINMGVLPEHLKSYLDSDQKLEAFAVGVSDKAVAVKVMGTMAGHSKNDIPHVTIAVNAKGGGKPVDSNKITQWTKLEKPIKLSGIVKELP
jgi:hypothetical protein